jgi:hypothetical protein
MSASMRLKNRLRDAPASGVSVRVPDAGVPHGEDEDGHRVEMSRKTVLQLGDFSGARKADFQGPVG